MVFVVLGRGSSVELDAKKFKVLKETDSLSQQILLFEM